MPVSSSASLPLRTCIGRVAHTLSTPSDRLHVHLAARPRPLLVGVTRRVALPYAADLKHALEHKADRARAETDRLDRSKAGADAGLATVRGPLARYR